VENTIRIRLDRAVKADGLTLDVHCDIGYHSAGLVLYSPLNLARCLLREDRGRDTKGTQDYKTYASNHIDFFLSGLKLKREN
jgi:hypothetical protein